MEYLPIFLLFMAVLIAAWFYLQRAKARDAGKQATAEPPQAQAQTTTSSPETTPDERPQ